jgi:hypothetical protein
MVSAGETMMGEEERAEAHRTIMRRLSQTGKAQTAKLGLSPAATAFIDLYLDLKRNKDEIRAGKAPRSRLFMGTPHPIMRVEEDVLFFSANFVTSIIDKAELPLPEIPAVIESALGDAFLTSVTIPSDDGEKLKTWGLELATTLLRHGREPLSKVKEKSAALKAIIPKILDALAARLPSVPVKYQFPLLDSLRQFGGDKEAKTIIEYLKELPGDAQRFARPMYIRCICGMGGNVARAFLKGILTGGNASEISSALGGIHREPDKETFDLIEKFFAKETQASRQVKSGAVMALERIGTPRAVAILESAFKEAVTEQEKLGPAFALTRLGSPVAVSYLKELIIKHGTQPTVQSKRLVERIKRILKQYEKDKKKEKKD